MFFFSSKTELNTLVYFAHVEEIIKIWSLLGVFKDKYKLDSNSYYMSERRQFKTSFIGGFATNIAFVYYKCENIGPSILTLFQERILNLPGCPENIPCPIGILKDNYPDTGEECDLVEMCYPGGKYYTSYNSGLLIGYGKILYPIMIFVLMLNIY